jgi:hypothetical protein
LDLRYRAVEIGFGKVGLEVNDLIEILDRQHIVLEIQGIPPDRGDTIGV